MKTIHLLNIYLILLLHVNLLGFHFDQLPGLCEISPHALPGPNHDSHSTKPIPKMDYVLTPVVLDNGSGMIKAGYAGEEIPKSFFPS